MTAWGAEVRTSSRLIPFETRKLTYDEKAGLVHLEQGFTISRDSQSLTGERLTHDLNTSQAEAFENLVFRDRDIMLRGNKLRMNTAKETFHWSDGVTGHFRDQTWFFRAKMLDGSSDAYTARRAVFTSCNKWPDPHYHIWAYKGRIYPGRKANFTHAVFHLGPVPFWYWPWWSKALSDEPRPTIYLYPGQNGRQGHYVRSIVAYPLMQNRLYLRTHLDYFGKLGIAGGPEILFRDGETRKGTLYFYTLKELNGLRQYDLRGDGYYQIWGTLSAQGTLRYQRDPSFNNLYNREFPEKVNPDLRSSLALNWRHWNLQFRGFYEDIWGYDPVRGKFWNQDQTLPGFETVLHPTRILGTAWFLNGNMVLRRHRTKPPPFNDVPFERWEDTGGLRLNRPWNLGFARFINGSIGALFDHSFQSKLSPGNFQSTRQSTYGGEASLRIAPARALDLNWTYTHLLRSERDSLRQDTKADDEGVAQRRLAVRKIGLLPFNAFLYAQTAYNFPAPCPKTPCVQKLDWTQFLEPVFASLSFAPYPGSSFAFSTNYEVFHRKYLHNITLSQLAGENHNITSNFGYDNRRPNYLLPTFIAKARVPGVFESVSLVLRTEYLANKKQSLSLDRKTFRYFERQLVVTPAFHDFLITLVFRSRPRPDPIREFFFTIRLRLSEKTERKQLERMREEEFYPWRAQQ